MKRVGKLQCTNGILTSLILPILGLTAVASAQPTNDNFANRLPITSSRVLLTQTLTNATAEPGEPFIDGVSSGQSAWWTWTAPSNGSLTLSAGGSGFNTLVTVYTGTELGNLSLIASNNYLSAYQYCGNHWLVRSSINFHVAKGQSYQIAVDSAIITEASRELIYYTGLETVWTTNILAGNTYQLGLDFTPAPANDDFANQITVRGSRLSVHTSNTGATKEPGEPNHLGNPGGSSIWYSWKAPASGRVTLSPSEIAPYGPPSWTGGSIGVIITWPGNINCGTESEVNPLPQFFPIFAAYTGSSVQALNAMNCLPLNLANNANAVCFDAVKGQTYQIAYDGNMGTMGDIDLFLALTTPAVNDAFEHRIQVHGTHVVANGYNAGATMQLGEPTLGDTSTGKTVWWSWTAPVSGSVTIDFGGSDYNFPVAVFTGSKVTNLNTVASGTGSVTFDASAGTTYQLAIGDAAGLTGAYHFTLTAPVVQLPLQQTLRGPVKSVVLSYKATPSQVVLLQQSKNGTKWQDVRTATAHGKSVNFAIDATTAASLHFRAIVIDWTR